MIASAQPACGPTSSSPGRRSSVSGQTTKLRHNAQRLLGQQLDQVNLADLVARVDALAHENRQLASERQQARSESAALRSRVTELEEDVAAARTALRRMIREHSTDIGDLNR